MKSKEEWIENYVIGAVQGAFKTKRYWMKKGFDAPSSIQKAVNYAVGQLSAGIGKSNLTKAESAFREMGKIAEAFANMIAEVRAKQEES
jgi:hypothetical protein